MTTHLEELERLGRLLRRAIQNIPEPDPTKPRRDDPIPGCEERRLQPNASTYYMHEIRPCANAFARFFREHWPAEYDTWIGHRPLEDPNAAPLDTLHAILAQEEARDETLDRLPQDPKVRANYHMLIESPAATVDSVAELLMAAVDDILARLGSLTPPTGTVQWTKPMNMKELRKALGVSHNTLKKRLVRGQTPEQGKYRCIGEGPHPRIIQVAIDDLPAKLQAKYRPQDPA